MSDAIRQAAEAVAIEWSEFDGWVQGHRDVEPLADIIERAMRNLCAERVAQAFSDGAAQHEKVWGAALMNEIANLKAQQAERVKEAERQARLAELRARLDEASRWHQFTEGHDDDGWCCKRESELGDELMALEYAAPMKHGPGRTTENQDLAGNWVCVCGKWFENIEKYNRHIKHAALAQQVALKETK